MTDVIRASFALALPTGGWRFVRFWYDTQNPGIEMSQFQDIPDSEGMSGVEAVNVAVVLGFPDQCDKLLLGDWPCPISH